MTNKINVLFLTVQLETIGGSERLIYDLASRLDRNLFNPSVCWLTGGSALKEFVELEIPLYHIPKSKRRDISTFIKLKNIIMENNIHVVNAHHFMPMIYSFYGCKMANNTKLFYTEHSQWEIGRASWKWEVMGKFLLNRLDGIIGVSDAVCIEMQKKYNLSPNKIFSIINGVDIDKFNNINDNKIIKSSLGFADHDIIIGIVANLKKVKNHIFLFKAFREVISEMKNVKLVLIGEGDKDDPDNTENELSNYVNENGLEGSVHFLGYRPDIPGLLSIMDVFCLTSVKEGLPISLIEAMASGLPLIGTNTEGIRDVIVPNTNGFLVQPNNVTELKNALLCLLRDASLCKALGDQSRIFAETHYSIKHCVEQYQDLFTR
jgi:glycosyltransferase involved in cell wall biosynthesis